MHSHNRARVGTGMARARKTKLYLHDARCARGDASRTCERPLSSLLLLIGTMPRCMSTSLRCVEWIQSHSSPPSPMDSGAAVARQGSFPATPAVPLSFLMLHCALVVNASSQRLAICRDPGRCSKANRRRRWRCAHCAFHKRI